MYIGEYTSNRKDDPNVTISRKSNISYFEKLKIYFELNTDLMNCTDHGYDENVFSNKELMEIFLNNWEKYNSLWLEWRYLTVDQIYVSATKWVETIIEMNSRAGVFHLLQ